MGELYDRDKERIKINEFLNNFQNFLLIDGPSGTGKSVLIEYMLNQNFEDIYFVQYSLKENKINSLDDFFLNSYQLYRKSNLVDLIKGQLNTSISISAAGIPGVAFGQKNNHSVKIDNDFLKQYIKTLENSNIKVLYISNIELANDEELKIIYKLINQPTKILKLILEIGSLNEKNVSEVHNYLQSKVQNRITLSLFDKYNSKELYKFVNKKNPPPSLYARTDGNSFAIVHFDSTTNENFNINNIVKDKLNNLNESSFSLLMYLYLFNGTIKTKLLKKILKKSLKLNNFDLILSYLNTSELIKINEETITFKHAFFYRYFDSLDNQLLLAHKQSIYKFLKKEYQKTKNYNISFELSKLSLDIKNGVDFFKYAWNTIVNSYTIQDYNLTVQMCELLVSRNTLLTDKQNAWVFIIYIQTSLLIGQGQNSYVIFKEKLEILKQFFDEFELSLIEALILYHQNDFSNSKKSIENLIPSLIQNNSSFVSLALSMQVSNFIAIGDIKSAKNYYIEAMNTIQKDDSESFFDLVRMSPRIEGFSLGGVKLQNVKTHKDIKQFKYLETKCLHNLGMCQLMEGNLEEAKENLYLAYNYFEKNELPELTYTMNALALYEISINNFKNAKEILLDGLNLCHEQYDKSTIYNNLGAISLINKEYDEAYTFCKKAEQILLDENNPLVDPVIEHRIYHNLWLIHYELKHENEKKYELLSKPPEIYFLNNRIDKYDTLKGLMEETKPIDYIIDNRKHSLGWTVSNFNCAFSKLSFYDFNFKVFQKLPLYSELS